MTTNPTTETLIEALARAIHEHLSRRDIMQYLDNDEDCEGIARAALTALATRPAPETTASDDVVEAAAERMWLGESAGRPWYCAPDSQQVKYRRLARHALANLPKPTEQATSPAPDAVLREALPATIGRLHLGERLSEDHYCGGSHDMPDGHPIYWQERGGEYPDDIDGFCLSCAIDQAESDAGWCECSVRAALASSKPTGERESAVEVGRWSWGYPDGIPGTPEYEPAARICNWCRSVEARCVCDAAAIRSGDKAEGEASLRARTEEKGEGK